MTHLSIHYRFFSPQVSLLVLCFLSRASENLRVRLSPSASFSSLQSRLQNYSSSLLFFLALSNPQFQLAAVSQIQSAATPGENFFLTASALVSSCRLHCDMNQTPTFSSPSRAFSYISLAVFSAHSSHIPQGIHTLVGYEQL